MKAMILSTSTGQGHNAAAMAITEGLIKEGFEVCVCDVFKLKDKKISEHASKLYTNVTIYAPKIFGVVYKLGDFVSSTKITSPVYIANSKYSKYLKQKIDEYKPDIIICPHIFPAETITNIKKKDGLDIPTVGIATDYTCSPFWEEAKMDYNVIPHEDLIPEFLKKGFENEKLLPLGIPVREKFRKSTNKEIAKLKYGFTNTHLFTVMGGSMGYGRMEIIALEILKKDKDCDIAFICAKNNDLYERVKNIDRLHAYKFIDNISELIGASDVLLTKPGGLSSTEAVNKGVPLVLTPPIPGCETKNEEFFKKHGVALIGRNPVDSANKAICLAKHKKLQQKQILAQKELMKNSSQDMISKAIKNIVINGDI